MNLDDLFNNKPIDLSMCICHSGGAIGSDTYFDSIGKEYKVSTRAYSYKTPKHISSNKVEISEEDYLEGVKEIKIANKELKRYGIDRYMNLLARNWARIKYSEETFAIGNIVEPGKKGDKYYNKSKYQEVSDGTGYAVKMSILHGHPTYVFDQKQNCWFEWSYIIKKYKKCDDPVIKFHNFAGIGTRNINENGINAIKKLYKDTDGR